MIGAATIVTAALVSTAAAVCSREYLQQVTDAYIAAQTSGNPASITSLSIAALNYTENDVATDITKGVLSTPVKIDTHRSFHDTVLCAAHTEIIAATNPHQYVIHTRLELAAGGAGAEEPANSKIRLLESVVTDRGDWAFNATGYLFWNAQEAWPPIPAAARDSRAVIQRAGDAYWDRFADSRTVIPIGPVCSRLEGGASTVPLNRTGDSCTPAGLPTGGIVATNRRYVVDEVLGVVNIFLGFPGLDRSVPRTPAPDSHTFRVENGLIRYIHTVTACINDGCGMNRTTVPPSVRVRA